MSRHFLLSLTDVNLDRSSFRDMDTLQRAPDWRFGARFLDRVQPLLDRVPPVERDVVELYYWAGKKQDVIGRLLGLSQQAVSHRLHSAYRRIIFMLQQQEVAPGQMATDLRRLIPNAFTVKVLCDFAATSSQTVTAKRLGVPQQRICWHLNAGLKVLRESDDLDAVFYVTYFEDLRKNRNILREVLAGRRKKPVREGETDRYAHYARGPARSYHREGPEGVAGREGSAPGAGARPVRHSGKEPAPLGV
jgi:predicted transcriptional regulator